MKIDNASSTDLDKLLFHTEGLCAWLRKRKIFLVLVAIRETLLFPFLKQLTVLDPICSVSKFSPKTLTFFSSGQSCAF